MSDALAQAQPRTSQADVSHRRRKALSGAMFGFFVDMYDVYLPVIVLAPAIAYFAPGGAGAVEMATLTGAIFAASLLGRPLGSIVFGAMGDRLGRRRTTIIVSAGFTVCTGLIALLPGYAAAGALAPVCLVVLRFFDGIFLGGEYTAANPLAMEYAPRDKRGLYGALLNVGYPAALAFITTVTVVLLNVLPSHGPDSAYAVWGWRIPFAIGFLLSAAVFVYYLRSVPESELWTKLQKTDRPKATLLTRRNLRSLGLAFLVGTGTWLTVDATVGVFAGHFKTLGASTASINTAILVAALFAIVLFPLLGSAGQRYGRRRLFLLFGALNLIAAPALLATAIGRADSAVFVVGCGGAAVLVAMSVWALITTYLMELFPTEVRASGYGIAYSLPSILPAFYPYYMVGLSQFMDYAYTPVVLLGAGGLFLLIGSWLSHDLRHVDLAEA